MFPKWKSSDIPFCGISFHLSESVFFRTDILNFIKVHDADSSRSHHCSCKISEAIWTDPNKEIRNVPVKHYSNTTVLQQLSKWQTVLGANKSSKWKVWVLHWYRHLLVNQSKRDYHICMTNYGHTSYILLNKQVVYVAYKYVFINKTLQKEEQG